MKIVVLVVLVNMMVWCKKVKQIQSIEQLKEQFRAIKGDNSNIITREDKYTLQPNELNSVDFKPLPVGNDNSKQKINKDYPQPYYPIVVNRSSEIHPDDIISVFNTKNPKQSIHKFTENEFFHSNEGLLEEQEWNKQNHISVTYPIYSKDKSPYYNRQGILDKLHQQEQQQTKNLFSVGVVNADDISDDYNMRMDQVKKLLRKNYNYYDPSRLDSIEQTPNTQLFMDQIEKKQFNKPTESYQEAIRKKLNAQNHIKILLNPRMYMA